MKLMLIFVGVFLISSIQCHESGSVESLNGMELNPFYDTIIFSDIADIMKDFESSGIPFFTKEDSESDENVEDLLREYQEYLDKENKQRKDYIERTKVKNKVPLLRHDRFSKINFGNGGKHGDMYNMYKNKFYNLQNTHKSKNALDLFLPVKPKGQYSKYGTVELTTTLPRDSMELNTFKKIMLSEEGRAPSFFPKMMLTQTAPCCKNGQFMAMGACKLCMNTKDISRTRLEPKVSLTSDDKRSDNLDNDLADPDDALNVRIKIDVQLPKIYDRLDRHQNAFSPDDGQKEFPLAIKMPSAFYNVPVPLNLYGYKRVSKTFTSPLHKLTIHKKKKSKSTSGGKKHRKKVITFHNIKLDPQQIYEAHFGKTTSDGFNDDTTDSTDTKSSTTDILKINQTITERSEHLNETQTEENIFLLVNISNNEAEESNKTNNSIETEYTNPKLNVTTETTLLVRKKRGISADNNNKSVIVALKATSENLNKDKIITENSTKASEKTTKYETKVVQLNKTDAHVKRDIIKTKVSKSDNAKADRSLYIEEDLLYWPNKTGNQSKVLPKNITTIILEGESKRGKLNMTKESMLKNHTRLLENAIFGDVDWNDVDVVAPAFMSFIGKYIEGALTFCSEVICHSMKCGQKVCQHRVCTPNDRFNNIGHCLGTNNTDSIATMESIMDLPTKIAFEIVDILQDKMAGKMFGKMTLCIGPKCITFVSSKKRFIKNKCTAKELDPKGHCVNTKEGKSA